MVLLPSATVLGKGSKVLRGAVSRTQLPPPPCSEHRLPEALLLLLDPGPASWQVSLPPAPPSMLSDSLSPSSPSSPGYLFWPARQKPTADSARLLSPPLTTPSCPHRSLFPKHLWANSPLRSSQAVPRHLGQPSYFQRCQALCML